jgi:hypothetical protein
MNSSAQERTSPASGDPSANKPRTEIQLATADFAPLRSLPESPPPQTEPVETPDYETLLRQDWDTLSWQSFLTWEGLRPLHNLLLIVLTCLMALPLFASGMEVVDPLTKGVAVVLLANFAYTLVPLTALGLTWLETPPRAVKVCTTGVALLLTLASALLAIAVLFHPHA